MKEIRELLSRDLSERIEEVIKVDQRDETTVHNEITEYVFTERIEEQYLELYDAISEGPGNPSEAVGVWVSGFFGSGKSSFAKNLGYVLENQEILSEPASKLFIKQLEEQDGTDPKVKKIRDLIEYINTRLDTHVIMFDVQVDRAVRRHTEPIAEVMYTVLLRELDYATDYDLAELEIELEEEGVLGDFIQACAKRFSSLDGHEANVPITLDGDINVEEYGIWRRIRKGAQRIQRTSAALHEFDPDTYPNEDSWAQSMQETNITVRTLVDRTFELNERRKPGHSVVYIIDEVGQYVARSVEKIENLRSVVEHFGQESKNRVERGEAVAPVWVIVTSQEKLDEVVAAIDDKRVKLARLQGRFHHRIDLAPADIREVASKRVLSKEEDGEDLLEELFAEHRPTLSTHIQLERTSRNTALSEDTFVQFYPYLPHFIDLSIEIVSGMRLQAGAPRHIGGSNRTIIKQAYEMLVSDRTNLADAPIGTLVSLDKIYDLIEGNLPSETQTDINDILQRWPENPWPVKVAKSVVLLEFVRDLPRTEKNITALLYDRLGDPSHLDNVSEAIGLLKGGQFIRQTENGWKLQTAQEKSWMAEKNALNPTAREENNIIEDILKIIYSDASLTKYRYKDLRTFRVGVSWENRAITSGQEQIPVNLEIADGTDTYQPLCDRVREESRVDANRNIIYWVMSLTTEIDDLITELYRSRRMVSKYDQLRAQNKINKEEMSSLSGERQEAQRVESRLQERIRDALAAGRGFFRGVSKDGASLGEKYSKILEGLLDYAVPDLYPKLELGAGPVSGKEPVEILKAANLNGLSEIFYGGEDGFDLIAEEEGKYVVNLNAPIIKEVSDFLEREHSYGNKVTGRTLENHFGGLGYGWEREILWLVMATMLRGAAIEVTYQGRRYRNHLDPQVRAAFSGTNAFRATSFAPRESIELPTLVQAAKRYESIVGEEVDVEEVAIARSFKELAKEELDKLLPVEATAKAHNVPVLDSLREYHETLDTIQNSPTDDCVRILAGEGASFQEKLEEVRLIRDNLDDDGLSRLRRLRNVTDRVWPALQREGLDGDLQEQVISLQESLNDLTFFKKTVEINDLIEGFEEKFLDLYEERHEKRKNAFENAIDDIRSHPHWKLVPDEMQETLLSNLERKNHERGGRGLTCTICHASLREMSSDLDALNSQKSQVLLKVEELSAPEEEIVRIKITDIIGMGKGLRSEEEVDEVLERLKEEILKKIGSGVKVILE